MSVFSFFLENLYIYGMSTRNCRVCQCVLGIPCSSATGFSFVLSQIFQFQPISYSYTILDAFRNMILSSESQGMICMEVKGNFIGFPSAYRMMSNVQQNSSYACFNGLMLFCYQKSSIRLQACFAYPTKVFMFQTIVYLQQKRELELLLLVEQLVVTWEKWWCRVQELFMCYNYKSLRL